MEQVRRYTTFEELKSSEIRRIDSHTRAQRHIDFEKVINALYPARVQRSPMCNPKKFAWQVIS